MNHSKAKRKFGRERKVRNGLMKSLALSLVLTEKIKTTEAKARELRPFIEKMITVGKAGTLSSHKQLVSKIGVLGAKKITKDLAPKYAERKGGYTRITKLPARVSDGALTAVIEFV